MSKKSRYPGIEIMSDGRKRVRLRAVDPRTGRMKEVDRIIEGTIEEAVRLRETLRLEVRAADQCAVEVPRLGDYATSWLKSRALAVKPSTATSYADHLELHIIPALGKYYIDKLTPEDMRAFQSRLARTRKPATVNDIVAVLKMLLSDAADEFQLSRSPADRIRALPLRKSPDEDPNMLEPAELGKLLAAFKSGSPEHYPLVLTLALTGLRFGEATALKWSDIDEEKGIIRVVRAQWHGIVSTTKTGKIRVVPLVSELVTTLREHRARLFSTQARGLEEGWVFPTAAGGLHHSSYLRKPLPKHLAKVGITRRFSIHGFRRTFNNLSRQVAGEIVTRSITGHVTQTMTEHYSHVGSEEKQNAAGRIVKLVFDASPPRSGGSSGGSK